MSDIGQTLGSSTDFTAPRIDVVLSICHMNGFLGASLYVLHERALSLISDTPAADAELVMRRALVVFDRVMNRLV